MTDHTPNPLPANIMLDKWADIGFDWHGDIQVQELARLISQLDKTSPPSFALDVHFGKRDGIMHLEFLVSGELFLTCQRCLCPVALDVSGRYDLAILTDEEQIGQAGDGEFVLISEVCPDGRRLPLRDLIEDELLLALPLSPRHAQACHLPATSIDDAVQEIPKQENPFAVLASLKKNL